MNVLLFLVLNFLISLIVIKTTAFIARERAYYLFLTAFLCAGFALLRTILYLSFAGTIVFQFGAVCLYVCLSFKFSNLTKFLLIYFCYYASTIFYAGVCGYLVESLSINSAILLVAGLCCVFVVLQFVAKNLNKKGDIQKLCFDVLIENEKKSVKCKAFLDTGNMLYDPITDNPVCLVNLKTFLKIFREFSEMDILTKSKVLTKLKNSHYIDLKTLTSTQKIFVFEVQKISMQGKVFENAMLGLCLKNFESNFDADLILHNCFATA